MILIRDKLTYEDVRHRFEREGYRLLSTEYKNAKSNLNVLCPRGHQWTTNISNFDFGRRCSICSKRKKYALEDVRKILIKEGYLVQDSIYINGKTPIKVTCPSGHETAISLNNFTNGKRCNSCRRMKALEARMKKLETKARSKEKPPRDEESADLTCDDRTTNRCEEQTRLERLAKLDEMRRNLKSAKKRTYQDSIGMSYKHRD